MCCAEDHSSWAQANKSNYGTSESSECKWSEWRSATCYAIMWYFAIRKNRHVLLIQVLRLLHINDNSLWRMTGKQQILDIFLVLRLWACFGLCLSFYLMQSTCMWVDENYQCAVYLLVLRICVFWWHITIKACLLPIVSLFETCQIVLFVCLFRKNKKTHSVDRFARASKWT